MLLFQDVEDSEEAPIWESRSRSSGAKMMPLGRVYSILFSAELRELERAFVHDQSRSQQGLVGKAASELLQHVREMESSGLSLEQTCIPILEHAVRSKEPSYRKKSVTLLGWLLQSSEIGVAVASTLEAIIGSSQWDNRAKLGWCVLVRELVQSWSGQVELNALHSKTCEIFVNCVPQLIDIVCLSSVREDKRRLPTRLTIAAADCLLTITKTLASGPPALPEAVAKDNIGVKQQKRPLISLVDATTDDGRSSAEPSVGNTPSTSSSVLFNNSERRELVLWEQLDNLILLVKELEEWNDRRRPLFAKGLQCIKTRLQLLANYRDSVQSQGGGEGDLSVGAAVLAACWHHYGGLMLTEDKKLASHPQPMLQHWLGALQYYLEQTENSDTDEENSKSQEMRGYALACLALVLGRLDARRLELILREFEPDLLKALFGQLHGADNTIVDLSVAILRVLLFRASLSTSEEPVVASPALRMESVVPMLLDMLDKRDIAARAVVLLVADYFAANPESTEMEQLFSRLDSVESGQRRNALDVLMELLSICTRSVDMINSSLSQTIAKHLFKRLGDTELTNRAEASALFAKLDPSFTLPTLLEFLYSPDGRVRSSASTGVLSVLKGQRNQSKVVSELLDCVTKLVKASLPVPNVQPGVIHKKDGILSTDGGIDVDRVMRLIPDWAATVEDWDTVIHMVVSKMFEEPANAVIPRFLSYISSQLADNIHVLFPLILVKMNDQPKVTHVLLSKLSKDGSEGRALGSLLFQRLAPLLVLRVLPLKAFSDCTCKELYGELSAVTGGDEALDMGMSKCIMMLLLDRACGAFEFEDVRKVASELMGRLLPDIVVPLVTAQLEDATCSQDLLRVKACLYILCTSLAIRGRESLNHPLTNQICQLLTRVLLWPLLQDDKGHSEVAKAQHGCIDCLAMMISAELLPETAVAFLDESPVEPPPSQKSQIELAKEEELSIPKWIKMSSAVKETKIKLIDELPDSEQLRRNQSDERREIRLKGIPAEEEIKDRPWAGKRQPKLIEEISDTEMARKANVRGKCTGDQRNGSNRSILSPVIDCLIGQQDILPWSEVSSTFEPRLNEVNGETCVDEEQPGEIVASGRIIVPLPFRVCMANVLISSCQKVALGARNSLAARVIPPLMNFVQVSKDSKLKGACLQVLFTAVYHLKTPSVLPYAVDLVGLSIAAIKCQGLHEERIGGVKLLASLLGSEEALVRELVPYLADAQLALSSVSTIDTSRELRFLCEKLLSCLSIPVHT